MSMQYGSPQPQQSVHLLPPRTSCAHVVVAPCVLCPHRRCPARFVLVSSSPRVFCPHVVVAPCVLSPRRRRPVRSVPTPSFSRAFCAHVVVVAMKKPTSALKGMDAICRTLISSTGRLSPFLQVSHHHPRRPLPQRPNHHVPARVSYLLREFFPTRFRLLITNCHSPSV